MTRAFHALTAEPWAIDPSWLPLLAAIALRQDPAGLAHADQNYAQRDYDLMAGPGAKRLEGSQRLMVEDGVAVLPITGPIFPRSNLMTDLSGATSVTQLTHDWRMAMADTGIHAIMLLMDTPGGAVAGIDGFADEVHAGAKKKLVAAHVTGNMASAGYWIGAQASHVFLERTGLVGSIGVVSTVRKQMEPDADGSMAFEIVSTNAPNKRPDPSSEEGVAEMVATLDAIEALFIADVARGRGVSVADVKARFGKGGVKVGKDAVEAGMADKVQSQAATMAWLKREAANRRRLATLQSK